MALRPTEWRAINWYMDQEGLTIRDMMKGPIVVFRDGNDKIVEKNISDIKLEYAVSKKRAARKKAKA